MSFNNRFSNLFTTIEIELAHSLPITNGSKEIMFFYEENESDNGKAVLGEVKYVAYRDIKNGELSKVLANEVIPSNILENINGIVISRNVPIEEELDKEDRYFEIYEKVFADISQGKKDKRTITKLYQVLKDLINCQEIMSIYNYLFDGFLFQEGV